jgi:hypothetical protein
MGEQIKRLGNTSNKIQHEKEELMKNIFHPKVTFKNNEQGSEDSCDDEERKEEIRLNTQEKMWKEEHERNKDELTNIITRCNQQNFNTKREIPAIKKEHQKNKIYLD